MLVMAGIMARTTAQPPTVAAPQTSTRGRRGRLRPVRLVVARCQVDYAGRLTAHLPMATRLLMVKADGSVLVHSDGGSYKPLNWMSPPCTLAEGITEDGVRRVAGRPARTDDTLRILLEEVLHDTAHDLGVDPGLQKDGVEKHLQELLAEHPATLADGPDAGTPRVPDRDRPGRPDVPRRRRAGRSPSRSSGAARSTASSS